MEADDSRDASAAAESYLQRNYPKSVQDVLINRLVDINAKRGIAICKACSLHMENDVLTETQTVRLCGYVTANFAHKNSAHKNSSGLGPPPEILGGAAANRFPKNAV